MNHMTALTTYQFTIPLSSAPSRRELFKREVMVIAGGFTSWTASGGWISPSGEHVREGVEIFNVALLPTQPSKILTLLSEHFPDEEAFYWGATGSAYIIPNKEHNRDKSSRQAS